VRSGLHLLLMFLLWSLVACQSPPEERLLRAGLGYLDQVVSLLESHRGDEAASLRAVEEYVAAHRLEFRANARDGQAALAGLSPEARAAFLGASKARLEPRLLHLRALVQPYSNRAAILRLVNEMTH
jgi:hypothetical protein